MNPDHDTDKERLAKLENEKKSLLIEVKLNELQVKKRIRALMSSKPLTQAEERELDLKVQQMKLDAEKRTAEISEKQKKVEIDRQDIISKAKSLKEKLSSINKASSLTDQEIRQHLSESTKWEEKLENIIEARVKLSKW